MSIQDNKIEDIFNEVGEAVPANQPVKQVATSGRSPKRFSFKKIIIWLVILIVIVGLVFGFIKFYPKFKKFEAVLPEEKIESPATEEIESVQEPEVNTTTTPVAIQEPKIYDSDSDGLTDDEEELLGTDYDNPDSDDDGMTDKEEVKIYHTDPLNSDTDGDGIFDWEEVKNNSDPKDSNPDAKLFDLQKEIEKLGR